MAHERTLDIAVQFSLRMEILKPPEELTDDDGNVLFSEDAGLHLQESKSGKSHRNRVGDGRGRLTRSEHEPPEQYLSDREGVGSAGRQPSRQTGRDDGWKYVLHHDPEV